MNEIKQASCLYVGNHGAGIVTENGMNSNRKLFCEQRALTGIKKILAGFLIQGKKGVMNESL